MTRKFTVATCRDCKNKFPVDKSDRHTYIVTTVKNGTACEAFAGHFTTKEAIMVEVTAAATQQIAEYFKGKEVTPIRIFLNEGG